MGGRRDLLEVRRQMSLLTSERTAVEILANLYLQRGSDSGLNNFARTVLGAHAEQAKRLAILAKKVGDGEIDLDALDLDAGREEHPEVRTTREVNGKELNFSLKTNRLPITTFDELVEFFEVDLEQWQPVSQQFNFWGSEASPNFQVKAVFQERPYQRIKALDREAFREFAKTFALGVPDKEHVAPLPEGNLLEIVVADLHASKFVEGSYDLESSISRLREATLSILRRANVDGIERIAFVYNGDTINDDNSKRTTTAGTPQESEGRWQTVFRRIRETIAELALQARYFAPVDIYIIPGNHDAERSFYLQDALWAYFANTDDITVHIEFENRAYIDWGVATIGLAHGDGIKPQDLAMTMLRETDPRGKHVWEWHLGHIHTRRIDEIHGVTLRRFRSPSDDDTWHRHKALNHNGKDIVALLWNKGRGQVAEYPYCFVGDT
jgi:predicted phosphodiesterase